MPEINGVIIDGVEYTFPGGGSDSSLPFDIISNNLNWNVPNSTGTLIINVDNLNDSDFPLKLFDSQILFYNNKYYLAYLFDRTNNTTTKDYNSKNILLADIIAGEAIKHVNLADLIKYLNILMAFVNIVDSSGELIVDPSWDSTGVYYWGQIVVHDFSLLEKRANNFDHSADGEFNTSKYVKVLEGYSGEKTGRITVPLDIIYKNILDGTNDVVEYLDSSKRYEEKTLVEYNTTNFGHNYLMVQNDNYGAYKFYSSRATLQDIIAHIAKKSV